MSKKIFVMLAAGMLIAGLAGPVFAMSCGDMSDHQQAAPAPSEKAVNVGNKICPVTGEAIDEKLKTTYEYKGKVYNFCCASCIDEFKKDPEKYIKKIEEELQAKPKK